MILAAQNKYWGTLEKATQFWLDLEVNHLMIKRGKDIELIDQEGKIVEEDFKKLSKLHDKYGVKFHIHPYNLILKNHYMTPSLRDSQPMLYEILINLDEKIHEYGLYPLITIHLPRFDHPKYHFGLDETIALENSHNFFKTLRLKSRLALETMHDPYRNPGHALLGYKAEHFTKLIGDRDFGLCIDTGHLKMAEESYEKFLKLPYPIYSVHLNGNDGTKDQHQLPTKENIGDFANVAEVLKRCEGPIVFEAADYNYSKNEIKECINFWKELIIK